MDDRYNDRELHKEKYPDNHYDIIAECEDCHCINYAHLKLDTEEKLELIKELTSMLFQSCGACWSSNMRVTISNEYYRPQKKGER